MEHEVFRIVCATTSCAQRLREQKMALFCRCKDEVNGIKREINNLALEFEKLQGHVVSIRNAQNASRVSKSTSRGSPSMPTELNTPEMQDFIRGLPEHERNELMAKLNNTEND